MKQKQMQFNHSNGGVAPIRGHGKGIWGNNRKSTGIRVDEKLYKAVKPLLIRYFGSTCGAIEPYLATLYSVFTTTNLSEETGVIPKVTIDIGNVNITRHMKVRRKMIIEEETEEVITMSKCFVNDCLNEAVTTARYKPEDAEYKICSVHAQEYRKDRNWDVTGRKLGE